MEERKLTQIQLNILKCRLILEAPLIL